MRRFAVRTRLLAAILAAAAIALGLVLASQLSARGGGSALQTAAAAPRPNPLLSGIAQRGSTLGSPRAPVVMVEYADLQCPYCAEFANSALPALVREYVRSGKVQLVFRGLAFIGPDSRTALRAAVAAGRQNRLWHMVGLLYRSQGRENSGWVSERLLRKLGGAIHGLDVGRMLSERDSDAVSAALSDAAQRADAAGVRSTPSFELGRRGEPLRLFTPNSLDPGAFRPALDSLLTG